MYYLHRNDVNNTPNKSAFMYVFNIIELYK